MSKVPILGFLLVLSVLSPLQAQTAPKAPVYSSAPAVSPSPPQPTAANTALPNAMPAGQAPDDLTNKIAGLVHAGKYVEARQLTSALLLAYPDDQRLVKARALLDKLPASPAPAISSASIDQPANNAIPALPEATAASEPLTGMEKVDYNALIALARQAQQTTDLTQQKLLLKQFMDQSGPFLQKHPNEMMLWELRAASAMTQGDPLAGNEAGQKLLTMGAADSSDSNLQSLLVQLKNQGWLGAEGAEKAEESKKYAWILGNWRMHYSRNDGHGHHFEGDESVDFSRSDSVFEGYVTKADGVKREQANLQVTILDSGEIHCEMNSATVRSCELADQNRTMTIEFAPRASKKDRAMWVLHRN